MENPKQIEDNIATFYERNNLHIPEVEKEYYFKEGQSDGVKLDETTDATVAKQYKLYKGFLATQKIKQSTQGRLHQVIPADSDPRNMRFKRSNVPMWEMVHKRIEEPAPEKFKKSDLIKSDLKESNFERVRLLDTYQDPSDLVYPEIVNYDNPIADSPYNPTDEEEARDEPVVQEINDKVTRMGPPTERNYAIHHVKPNDTIGKLCLQYNVNKDVIRLANDFTGEEIYMFKTLKIPYTYGKMYESLYKEENEEEAKKRFAVDALSKIMEHSNKRQKNFDKEAKYYLEMNNYILDKAIAEFEADLEFEKEVVKENKKYKQKKKRGLRMGINFCF